MLTGMPHLFILFILILLRPSSMGNNDLDDAKEEILRLKLIIGLKSDGSLSRGIDVASIKSEMVIRMKVMAELQKEQVAEREVDKANDKYEKMLTNYASIQARHNTTVDEIEYADTRGKELTLELENTRRAIAKARRNVLDLTEKVRELGREIDNNATLLHEKRQHGSKSQRALGRYLSDIESSRENANGAIKRYNDLAGQGSRKKLRVDNSPIEVGRLSRTFEMGVKI